MLNVSDAIGEEVDPQRPAGPELGAADGFPARRQCLPRRGSARATTRARRSSSPIRATGRRSAATRWTCISWRMRKGALNSGSWIMRWEKARSSGSRWRRAGTVFSQPAMVYSWDLIGFPSSVVTLRLYMKGTGKRLCRAADAHFLAGAHADTDPDPHADRYTAAADRYAHPQLWSLRSAFTERDLHVPAAADHLLPVPVSISA